MSDCSSSSQPFARVLTSSGSSENAGPEMRDQIYFVSGAENAENILSIVIYYLVLQCVVYPVTALSALRLQLIVVSVLLQTVY